MCPCLLMRTCIDSVGGKSISFSICMCPTSLPALAPWQVSPSLVQLRARDSSFRALCSTYLQSVACWPCHPDLLPSRSPVSRAQSIFWRLQPPRLSRVPQFRRRAHRPPHRARRARYLSPFSLLYALGPCLVPPSSLARPPCAPRSAQPQLCCHSPFPTSAHAPLFRPSSSLLSSSMVPFAASEIPGRL